MARHNPFQDRKMRGLASFDVVDDLPPDIRACVHEYGVPIVVACFKHGVTNAPAIREIVREIWEGPRQNMQRNHSRNSRWAGADVIDWILINSGSNLSCATMVRAITDRGLIIVPREPSVAMVEASKATVSSHNMLVTKTEKHRLRLRAANAAGFSAIFGLEATHGNR